MSERPKRAFPVVISGAGIGGLTVALALHDVGYDVCLLEKAPELREAGAGLQLSPNACSVMEKLGVLDDLVAKAVRPSKINIRSGKTGKTLGNVPLGDTILERHGYPYLVLHRADLQATLLQHVQDRPGIELRLGCELHDIEFNEADHVTCLYRTGEDIDAVGTKAIIGADGVWSKTRTLIPEHNRPQSTGQTAYRTTIPMKGLPKAYHDQTHLWLGRNAHVVHYPVSAGNELNIVVLIEEHWREKGWSAPADASMVNAALNGWSSELLSLVERSPKWLKWALCGVDASGPWSHRNLALLGDAAHGMLPYAAQGGAMAIEDAFVLARTLKKQNGDAHSAFRIFEATRKERVKKVQGLAFRNASIYHMGGPMALARNTVMGMMPPQKMLSQMDWIYSWKAEV